MVINLKLVYSYLVSIYLLVYFNMSVVKIYCQFLYFKMYFCFRLIHIYLLHKIYYNLQMMKQESHRNLLSFSSERSPPIKKKLLVSSAASAKLRCCSMNLLNIFFHQRFLQKMYLILPLPWDKMPSPSLSNTE